MIKLLSLFISIKNGKKKKEKKMSSPCLIRWSLQKRWREAKRKTFGMNSGFWG